MPVILNDRSEIVLRATANTSLIANNANYYRTLDGTVSQTNASNTVTGTSTSFLTDLAVGDYVRWTTGGYVSKVHSIASDTSMVVTARGANNTVASRYGVREPNTRTVHGFIIDEMKFAGTWTVKRGANTIANLTGAGEWKDLGLAEYRGASIALVLPTGQNGTMILKAKKTF